MFPLTHKLSAAAVLAACLALATPALSAEPVPPQAKDAEATRAPQPMSFEDWVGSLRSKLKITDVQSKLWDEVAKVMRENAATRKAIIMEMQAHADTMTAMDDLRAHTKIAEAWAKGTAKMTETFGKLYATMSDGQKKIADEVFRQHKREFASGEAH